MLVDADRPFREQSPDSEPDVTAPPDRTKRRWLVGFALAAAVLVSVPLVVSRLVDQPEAEAFTFEIPPGTAERLAAGEDVDVLPADLRLDLQDRLVVVNLDDRSHQIGPFTLAPGERLDRRFADTLSISGFCSLHASGSIDIEVRPRG